MPLSIDVRGFGTYTFNYLVTDLNGTLTTYGKFSPRLKELINQLKTSLEIFIITADTLGTGAEIATELGISIKKIYDTIPQNIQKADFVEKLGSNSVIAFGNGKNDAFMLTKAALSFGIMNKEGISSKTMLAADIIVNHVEDALEMLLEPKYIKAGLRL